MEEMTSLKEEQYEIKSVGKNSELPMSKVGRTRSNEKKKMPNPFNMSEFSV